MIEGVTTLSLIAAGLYIFVGFTCVAAYSVASSARQPRSHIATWFALALFCTGLVLLRVFSVEEWLRGQLREAIVSNGTYAARHIVQSQAVVALLIVAVVLAFTFIHWAGRRVTGRRTLFLVVAQACGVLMVLLIAIRVVSLHATDALLFGPLKLNWIADFGLSVGILGSALAYRRLFRSSSEAA